MFSYTKGVTVLLFLFFLSTSAQAVEQDLESSRDSGGVIWWYAVLPGPSGVDMTFVFVRDVLPGSFAEYIGIKERDILVELNGEPMHIMSPMEVGFRIVAILRSPSGTLVNLVMLRKSKEVFFTFEIQ